MDWLAVHCILLDTFDVEFHYMVFELLGDMDMDIIIKYYNIGNDVPDKPSDYEPELGDDVVADVTDRTSWNDDVVPVEFRRYLLWGEFSAGDPLNGRS